MGTDCDCIHCEDLQVSFKGCGILPNNRTGPVRALDQVSFTVERGEVFGVLGPNGSGKTTLMKVISTIILPTAGKVTVGGFDVQRNPSKVRGLVGLASGSERSFYYRLTGRQNLRFFASAQGIKPQRAREAIDHLLGHFGLEEASRRMYMTYSTGMRRKLLIARAMLGDPSILLLDEPTASLDPVSARNLRNLIKEMNREGKTIVLSTHYLREAEELCDRVVILRDGTIIASGTPQGLVDSMGEGKVLELRVLGLDQPTIDAIRAQTDGALLRVSYLDPPIGLARLTFQVKEHEDDFLTMLVQVLASNHVRIIQLDQKEPTLEEAFLRLAEEPGVLGEQESGEAG